MKSERKIIIRPHVLILKEKHVNLYYYIPDDESLFKCCLAILSDRKENKRWYYKPQLPIDPGITEEMIRELVPSLQSEARNKLKKYNQEMKYYNNDLNNYNDIELAIKNQDGKLAWQILNDRSGYEYEGIELGLVESV